jgi:hypothetical protein
MTWLVHRVSTVLRSGPRAISALSGEAVVVLAAPIARHPFPAFIGPGLCFLVRPLGLGFRREAPHPPGPETPDTPPGRRVGEGHGGRVGPRGIGTVPRADAIDQSCRRRIARGRALTRGHHPVMLAR